MRNFLSLNKSALPAPLTAIPHAPKQLYIEGLTLDTLLAKPRVAIIGSRKVTPYGRHVTEMFARELAQKGVVIVSGLALGVDAIAHKAALDVGGLTMAILPSGLDAVYPSTNRSLARTIISQGGVLISEYPTGTHAFKQNFIARNRLVSGISDAVLVTEASESSGTMHTAAFAQKQARPLFAVPGNITNHSSAGTNILIQTGARAALKSEDILQILNIQATGTATRLPTSDNPTEQRIIDLIAGGIHDGGELLRTSTVPVHEFNQALTMLEITGLIKNDGNNQWNL